MEKEKKVINDLTVLFISHKSDIKTFLNWILREMLTSAVHTHFYLISYIYTHQKKKKKFSIFNQNYV